MNEAIVKYNINKRYISFSGDIFKNLPFFTCWSRKNEEEMIFHQTVTKLGLSAGIPDSFNITLEFHGYNKPFKCSGSIENPMYHDVWGASYSRDVLKHKLNLVFTPTLDLDRILADYLFC